MKRLLSFAISFLFMTTAFCQTESSIDEYLNKLIKKRETEKGFISNETYDLMRHLIETIIKEKYSDTLRLYATPQNFETTVQDKKTIFYQVAPVNVQHGALGYDALEHDALFIWAMKTNRQWSLFSHYEKRVPENTTFKYKSANGFDFFICPTFCAYGKSQDINWEKIDFATNDKKYFQVYRMCEMTGDSSKLCMSSTMNTNFFPEIDDLQNRMVLAISKTENFEKRHQLIDSFQTVIDQKTQEIISQQGQKIILTASDFIFKDLDGDDQEEIFWFSVSDKSIIDFKVYHLTAKGLTEAESRNYVAKLPLTKEYSDLISISNLRPYGGSQH